MTVFEQADIRSLGRFELPTTEPGRGGMRGLSLKLVNGVRTFYALAENQNAGQVVELSYPGVRNTGPFPVASMVRDHGNTAWAMAETLAPHVGVSFDRRGLFFDHDTGLLLQFFFVNYGGLAAGPNEQSIVAGKLQPDGTFAPFGCFGIENAYTGPNGSGAAALPPWFVDQYLDDETSCTMTGGGSIASPSMSVGPALHSFDPRIMLVLGPNDGRSDFHGLHGQRLSVFPRNFTDTNQPDTTGPFTHPLPARHLITNYEDNTWGWGPHEGTGFWNQTTAPGQPQVCLPVWTDQKQGLLCIPQVHWGQYRGIITASGADWIEVDRLDWSNANGSGSLAIGDQINVQYDPTIGENAFGSNACQVLQIDGLHVSLLVRSGQYSHNSVPLVSGNVIGGGGYVAAYPVNQRASVILQIYDLHDVGKITTGELQNDMLVPTSQRMLQRELTGDDWRPGLIYGGQVVYQPMGIIRDPEWPVVWIGMNQIGSAGQGMILAFSLDANFVLPEAEPPVVIGGSPGGPSVAVNDAQFVSQAVASPMIAGKSAVLSVKMTNTGSATWTKDGPKPYRLGASGPRDNTTWGLGRVDLIVDVPPQASAIFLAYLTAPSTPGTYTMQWEMVQDFVEWFGQPTPPLTITVVTAAPVEVPPPAVTLTRVQIARAHVLQAQWLELEADLPEGYAINRLTLAVTKD